MQKHRKRTRGIFSLLWILCFAYLVFGAFSLRASAESDAPTSDPNGDIEWSEPSYEWASDNKSVTATRVNKNDPNQTESETVSATDTVSVYFCIYPFELLWTSASFDNPAFEVQTKTERTNIAYRHSMVQENSINSPTCERSGTLVSEKYCSLCEGERSVDQVYIPALGHLWDEGSITKQPTCEEFGIKTFVCERDNAHTKTEEIEKLPHTPGEPVTENKVRPTCEHPGYDETITHCEVCGTELDKVKTDIPATGHDWGEWQVVKEASENEEGREERVCKNDASHVETRPIPKTGSGKGSQAATGGKPSNPPSDPPSGDPSPEPVVDANPKQELDGPPEPEVPPAPSNHSKNHVPTGDESHSLVLFTLMLSSACMLGAIVYNRR
ncbi:MAG: hypothetical protein J5935_02075 [Lachnospiraceae bacterium]|nr:hypothetical protein [Lachnospiraceae bacterium]